MAKNIWNDGPTIEFDLSTEVLIAFDIPLLGDIKEWLLKHEASEIGERPEALRTLPSLLRAGVYRIKNFVPGTYSMGNDDLEPVEHDGAGIDVFDVDTGNVVLADLGCLSRLVDTLTYERFDHALRSPIGDDTRWLRLSAEVGGPFFGILEGDINTSFSGDGSYRIRSGTPRLVAQ